MILHAELYTSGCKFGVTDRMHPPDSRSASREPTFDADAGVYRLHCDWRNTDGAAMVITEAVAAVRHCDALELEPLQDVVDVDGLEALLAANAAEAGRFVAEFDYEGTTVRVERSGQIVIEI